MQDTGGQSGTVSTGLFDKRLALSVSEVAEAIGRSQMAIYHLIRRGAIPCHKRGGRWVFIPEEIRAWLTNGKGATNVS
jgi:excisionase family DNA binding protein